MSSRGTSPTLTGSVRLCPDVCRTLLQRYSPEELVQNSLEVSGCVQSLCPDELSLSLCPDEVSSSLRPDEVSSSLRPDEVSSSLRPDEVSSSLRPDEVSSSLRPDE